MGHATWKQLILFIVMGFVYLLMELLWRGHTHWTMFIVGGICGLCIDQINEVLSWDTPLWLQAVIGDCIVVTVEFISGCVLNLWFKWGVWDYSHTPFNLLGQICLPYAVLWIPVVIFAIILGDMLRWMLLGEEKPRYKLF